MRKLVVFNRDDIKRLIRERRRAGVDRFDEVWDGVYMMSSNPDNQHQHLAHKLTGAIEQAIDAEESYRVFSGVNITDREENWEKNYRCPDVVVFLPGNPAQDRGTHWYGGPDFAVEIISPN